MGLVAALGMAVIVYAINADHGFGAAIPAALKQGIYTMLAGGFLTRQTERIALSIQNSFLAHFTATAVPTLVAVGLTLILHFMKGTPEPVNSTIPTMILAPPSFFWWAWRQRRRKFGVTPDVPTSSGNIPEQKG